jgi:hypothetical protein
MIRTVTGHSGLARNTSGDDNNLSTLQAGGETLGGGLVTSDLIDHH